MPEQVKRTYKYIVFGWLQDKTKTSVWGCYNLKSHEKLGEVKWYAPIQSWLHEGYHRLYRDPDAKEGQMKAEVKWVEIDLGVEIENIDWPTRELLWVDDVDGNSWLSRDQGETFEKFGRSRQESDKMILSDLVPSYILMFLGCLMIFCGIFAKDQAESLIFLSIALCLISGAWFISTRLAKSLWTGREKRDLE